MPSLHGHATPRAANGLWPREHGAYVQLLAPLLSALAFGRPTLAALGCAVLALVVFVAHEPLVVLLGRRGSRFRAAHAHSARAELRLRLMAATLLGLVLMIRAPELSRALLLSAALSLAALAALLHKREKSLLTELLAGAALTSFSVPVLVAQGVRPASIAAFMGGWLAILVLATLTARAYVYRRRDGAWPLRLASIAGAVMLALSLWLASRAHVPLAACLALGPFALVAAALHFQAYRPRTPKALGWALTAANLGAVVLLGMTLAHTP